MYYQLTIPGILPDSKPDFMRRRCPRAKEQDPCALRILALRVRRRDLTDEDIRILSRAAADLGIDLRLSREAAFRIIAKSDETINNLIREE